jgi:chromosome segregation ATPase
MANQKEACNLDRLERLEKENQELRDAYIHINEELHCAFARGIDSARFDVLEENEQLKDKIAYLQDENEDLQTLYESSRARNQILKAKNERLTRRFTALLKHRLDHADCPEIEQELEEILGIFIDAFVKKTDNLDWVEVEDVR